MAFLFFSGCITVFSLMVIPWDSLVMCLNLRHLIYCVEILSGSFQIPILMKCNSGELIKTMYRNFPRSFLFTWYVSIHISNWSLKIIFIKKSWPSIFKILVQNRSPPATTQGYLSTLYKNTLFCFIVMICTVHFPCLDDEQIEDWNYILKRNTLNVISETCFTEINSILLREWNTQCKTVREYSIS